MPSTLYAVQSIVILKLPSLTAAQVAGVACASVPPVKKAGTYKYHSLAVFFAWITKGQEVQSSVWLPCSAFVASSTFPATVSLAFGVLPASISAQAPPIYCWFTQSAMLYISIPFTGLVIAASLAASSAYIGTLKDQFIMTVSKVCVHQKVLFPSTTAN
jgi:hypothetical protein